MEQANRNEEQTFVPTLEDWFRKYHDRRTGMTTPKGSLTVYAEDLGVPKEVLKQEEDWYNDGQPTPFADDEEFYEALTKEHGYVPGHYRMDEQTYCFYAEDRPHKVCKNVTVRRTISMTLWRGLMTVDFYDYADLSQYGDYSERIEDIPINELIKALKVRTENGVWRKMKKLYNGRPDAFESFYKFVKENGLTHKYQVWLP